MYVQRSSLWCQSKVDVLRVSDMNCCIFALIGFQVLHLRHPTQLQKLLFEFNTHKTCTGSSTGSQVVSSHPIVGSNCALPGCGHLLLHGVFQHGARWTLQSNRMIFKSWAASRHVVFCKCFFYFVECVLAFILDIAVTRLFTRLWLKHVLFTRCEFRTRWNKWAWHFKMVYGSLRKKTFLMPIFYQIFLSLNFDVQFTVIIKWTFLTYLHQL